MMRPYEHMFNWPNLLTLVRISMVPLLVIFFYLPFYWTSAGQAELDFILQLEDIIYPLEVKSGTSMRKKSLLTYTQKYCPQLAIRISPMNLKLDGAILNLPLYLMEKLSDLVKKIAK